MNKFTITISAAVLAGVSAGSAWFLAKPDRDLSRITERFTYVREQRPDMSLPTETPGVIGATSVSSNHTDAGMVASRGLAMPTPVSTSETRLASHEDIVSFAATENEATSTFSNSSSIPRAALAGGRMPENGATVSLEPSQSLLPQLTLELSPGVREPALMYDTKEEISDQQALAISDLTDHFVDKVANAANRGTEDDLLETWDHAQEEVDSYYRNIFGEASYHQMTMEAAIADMARSGNL